MASDCTSKIQSNSQTVDLYVTSDGQLRVVAVEGGGRDSRRDRDLNGATLISRSGAPTLAGVSLLSLLLAACGGGGSGGGGGGGGALSAGVVVDGYLAGMKVYRVGAPGTFVTTDANGVFSGLGGTGDLVAEPGAGGAIDKSTNLAFLVKLMAPEGATVISPLTTLLQMLGVGQEVALKSALGLNANINLLTYDPVAANNVAAQVVSAQVANVLSVALKYGSGDFATQLVSKIAAHQPIDLMSSAFLRSIGLPSDIADAVSRANSVTATDLAGIAQMQKLVQQLAAADAAGQPAALAKFLADFAGVAQTVDLIAPDAPTAIDVTAEGGTVVAGFANASNTNLTAHATIAAGKATSGKAELLVNGVVIATDSTILHTDTQVDFNLGASTAAALKSALTSGGVVAVKLYDAAGNVVSANAASTLTVDYVAPTLTMTAPVTTLKAGDTALVTLTFSETPVGFVAGDLTTSLGTLSSLAVSPTNPKVYTAIFTPNANTDLSSGSITLTGAFTDAAGNSGTATGSLTLALDTKAPTAPTMALASDTGSSATDGVTSASTVNVTGVETGATWQYRIDSGAWTTGGLTLQAGTHAYEVRQTDAAGNVGAASSATYTLDTAAPSALTMTLASDTGSSSSDSYTSASTLNVSGLEVGATWEYKIGTGNWTVGTGTSLTLQAGANAYAVRQTDAAGNVSASSAITFTLDTSAPTAPTLALASDTGANTSDALTNNATLNVSGIESGATWQYKIDSGSWTTGAGTSLTLLEGAHTYQVRQTDLAGNVSADSSTATYTLDTGAPAALTMTLASDTGSSSSDGYTSASTLNVSGLEVGATWEYKIGTGNWTVGTGTSLTLQSGAKTYEVRQTDAAGNVSASSPVTFTLDTVALAPTLTLASDTGSSSSDRVTNTSTVNVGIETGATWEYSTDNTNWTAGSPTNKTVTLVGEGLQTFYARQVDLAGNASPTGSQSFTRDTVAPAALTMALASDTGSSSSDRVTSNATVNVSGFESLGKWEYKIGAGNWTPGVGTTLQLVTGEETYQIRQYDLAGNVSSATSATYTLDQQAPASPAAITPALSPATDTGASNIDGVTSNNHPTVIVDLSSLNCSVGDIIVLYAGAAEIMRATLTSGDLSSGLTQYALAIPGAQSLPNGVISLSIKVIDPAGNVSAASAIRTVTIDTLAPTVAMDPITGDLANGFAITGTSTGAQPGDFVSVVLNGKTYQGLVGSDGNWSAAVSAADAALLSGSYSVSATVNDLAGNVSVAATKTLAASVSGIASDGYISGATYFVDTNGDTLLDAGETSTTGDSVGNYRLPSGPVVMKGGVDISTRMDFTSVYEAPTDYRTITPITTLVREISKLVGQTVSSAETSVKAIFGLGDVTLSTFNPLIEAAKPAGEFGAALVYQKIAAELSIFMDVGSTVLGKINHAVGDAAVLAQTQDYSIKLMHYLAEHMTSAADLSDATFIKAALNSVTQFTTSDTLDAIQTDALFTAAADQIAVANGLVAGITAADTTSVDTIAALTTIVQYQIVVKGEITNKLLGYIADPSSASLPAYNANQITSSAPYTSPGVLLPALVTGTLLSEFVRAEGAQGSHQDWTFDFTRTGDLGAQTTLHYEVLVAGGGSAADFDGGALPAGTFSFAAGNASATFTIATLGNDIAELRKSFTLKVWDAAGNTQFLDSSKSPTGALNFAFALTNDDAPSLAAPAALELQTGLAARISGVSVTYPDADAQLTVTLTGIAGTKIVLPDGSNVTGNGTNIVTLTGKAAAVNAALATLSVSSPAGSDHLTMTVSAEGVAATTTTEIAIHLHEASTIAGPADLPALVAGTPIAVTGITAGDPDSPEITAQVKVTAGTASFATLTNVVLTTDADGVISLKGAPADVSNALASMKLAAASATSQLTLTVTVIDGDAVTVDPTLVLRSMSASAPTALTAPTTATIEQGHATAISGVSISDADSASVKATVTSNNGVAAFASGTGATLAVSGSVTTITGTVAQVNSALASMKFTATATGSASLRIVADDFDAVTAAVTKTIALTVGANAAPEAGGNQTLASVSGETASTLTLDNIHLVDSSGGAPTQIRILSVEGGVLTAADGSPITLGAAGTSLTVVGGSLALGFTPSAHRTADVRISYVVVDPDISTQNSAASIITVPITSLNVAPVLVLTSETCLFTEGGAPSVLAGDLVLSDVDSTQMASAVVTISNGASDGDVRSVTSGLPTGVTASFVNGTLTITGSATVGEYQAILRSVAYSNTSDAPSSASRTITFSVSDGLATSVEKSRSVSVSPVNDAPVVDLNGDAAGSDGAASVVRGLDAVVLAPSATVFDVDSPTLAKLSVVVTAARPEDVLSLTEAAQAAANAAGVTVHAAVYSSDSHTLQFDITGAAISPALAQPILRGVTFSTTAASGVIDVQVRVTDGAGAVSDVRTISLDVVDPTSAPISATDPHFTNGVTTAQIVFSEAVTGFAQEDLSITNGVIESITQVDDVTYNVTFKPTGPTSAITLTGDYTNAAGHAGAKGASLAFTSAAPQLVGDTSPRTIDEDLHNTGRVVTPGVTINDADNHDFAGGSLRAHINNRIGFSGVAGEVLGVRGLSDGSVFFRTVGDDIYYRQGTIVAADGTVTTSDANPADDIMIGSFATIGDVRQDGSKGADLVINLNENATPAITQTLASNIVFAVKLSGGGYTQAWQNFVSSNTSVTLTLDDGQGNTSTLLKPVSVVAHNDAPVVVSDAQEIAQSATEAVTGNVLTNDTDADNVAGLPTQQTLTVSDVAAGRSHATFSNHSATLQGAYGMLTISDTGAYSYELDKGNTQVASLVTGESLVETFAYNVSDGVASGTSSTLAITINGTAANVEPVAVADVASMGKADASTSGNVLSNDTDANGQSTHVTGVPSGSVGGTFTGDYGVLTLTEDGAYTYTPDPQNTSVQGLASGETLTESFEYFISDGHGGTASSTLTITINGTAADNAPPTGNNDYVAGTPYVTFGGYVLVNDTDPEHQTLTVIGANHDGMSGLDTADGFSVVGLYGTLVIHADGGYEYFADTNLVRANASMFSTVNDIFTYQLSDGHGGVSTATLDVEIVNSPFVIGAAKAGSYDITETIGGVTTVIDNVVILEGSSSVIWTPPATFNPTDGSHTLSLSGGATINVYGDLPTSTFGLTIVDYAHLPAVAAQNTLYIVHDTRAHIEAAAANGTIYGSLAYSNFLGVIVNGDGPADGGLEPFAASLPVLGYDTQISMPSAARTVDENANNTGRLIAFSGTGLAIAAGTENTNAVGPVISDADGNDSIGATLNVHINNAVTNLVGGDVLFLKQGSSLFRTDALGNIYYRQGTTIDGATSDAVVVDSNLDDDIQFASFNVNSSGKFLNGMGGRDLTVTFNEHSTMDMVQLLAGHIGFGIRLNSTDGTAAYTDAWQQYLPASGVQQSVTFTITDAAGRSNTASRDINVTEVNDAPLAHNDLAAIGKSAGSINGWVLGNDDPDLLPNQGSGSTSLPAGLAVTDVWTGTSSHQTLGTAFTGTYGTMTLKADGTYTYVLNTSNSEVAALTTSSTPLLDVFHYTMTDGTASSSADLKIMIDALGAHWGPESKTASSSAAEIIFKYAGVTETQHVYGFGGNDVLGAVGPGTVKVDGGDGDDIMYALATYTSLKGGAGADKFVIGSADIHVRIEDLDILASNATLDPTKDIVDFSQLFGGMSETAINDFFTIHMTEVTDGNTGKISTLISFDGLSGATHTGDLTLVGVTLAQAQHNVQGETSPVSGVAYTLLDELRLIANNHG